MAACENELTASRGTAGPAFAHKFPLSCIRRRSLIVPLALATRAAAGYLATRDLNLSCFRLSAAAGWRCVIADGGASVSRSECQPCAQRLLLVGAHLLPCLPAANPPPLAPLPLLPLTGCRLLYWTAADGAARREAYDALADSILCLGSSSSTRWSAQAAALRRVQVRLAAGGRRAVEQAAGPAPLMLPCVWANWLRVLRCRSGVRMTCRRPAPQAARCRCTGCRWPMSQTKSSYSPGGGGCSGGQLERPLCSAEICGHSGTPR